MTDQTVPADFTYRLLTKTARGRPLRKDQAAHLIDAGYLHQADDDTYTLTDHGITALAVRHTERHQP